MVKRVTTKVIEEVETEDGESSSPKGRPSRRRWFLWRGAILLALLAALAHFAPAILATTGLWKTVLAIAVPALSGKVDAGSISLGWFSPIVIKDLTVRDLDGEVLAQVGSLRSEKTLLDLARNQADLGKFTVDSPQAVIVLRADGSNVEDLLALLVKEFEKKENKPTGAIPAFSLELTRGRIELIDRISARDWQLAGLELKLDFPAAPQEARTGSLSAIVSRLGENGDAKSDKQLASEIAATLSWQPSAAAEGKPAGLGAGKLTCDVKSLPVELAEGPLRRFVADLRPAGPLSGTLVYEWKDDLAAQRLDISKVSSPQLSLASPTYLGSDKPALELTSASGGVELTGKRVLVDQLEVRSSLAALSASLAGEAPSLDLAGILAALQSSRKEDGAQLAGQVDLAALARQLPTTLRLRADTRITEGLLDFSLKSGLAKGERAWQASASTSRLVAETAGRRIAWQQPVEFSATARQTKTGFVIDELLGKASFANLQGGGTLDAGSLSAQADLDKLVAELGQFVDWTGIDLAGQMRADVKWQRGQQDAFTASAETSVQNFQLAAPGIRPWQERDLRLTAQAQGTADTTGIKQIASANLSVISGADQLTASLQKPVTQFSTAGPFPLAYTLQGDLATWLPRLQTVAPLSGWQISGGIEAEGSGEFSMGRVVIAPTKVTLTQLSAASDRLSIREPKVVVEAAGTYDQEAGTFTSNNTTFASSALAFRADDLKASFGKEGMSLSGHVEYRAKLEVLSSWLGAPQYPRTWQLGGDVVGGADARMEKGVVQASLSTEIENLAYSTRTSPGGTPTALRGRDPAGLEATPAAASSPWQVAWSEPKVSISGEGSFDPKSDRLELRAARFDSAALVLAAAGNVDEVSKQCKTALQGEISYDMAGITQKLQPILGKTLRLTGQEQRKFSLTGPLFTAGAAASTDATATPEISALGAKPKTPSLVPDELTAAAGFGWQSAEYYGLAAGAASIDARLEKGLISVTPLEIPLSEGKLTAAPRLYLNEPGMPVVLEKGPLLDNVRISPELCRDWLKYVQPTIADATRAEGKFSLAVEQAQVPLLAPKTAAIRSTLTIHQGQVGPGPLATKYLDVLQKVRAFIERKGEAATIDPNKGWIIFPEQQVPVVVQDQRVHHQGMIMQIGNTQVVTQGSVGLDDSLDMLLIIPVQDSWLRDPKAGILKGKTIRVPVRGTVTAPQPDIGRVLSDLGKQIAGNAVKDIFKGELDKAKGLLDRDAGKMIDNLFNKKPKP